MSENEIQRRLSDELKSFENVWEGGYCEGEVLDPVGYSTYGPLGVNQRDPIIHFRKI